MVFNDVIEKIGMTIDAAGVVVIVTGAAIAFVATRRPALPARE